MPTKHRLATLVAQLLACVLCLATARPSAAGKLDRASERVEGKKEEQRSSKSNTRSRSSASYYERGDSSDCNEPCEALFRWFLLAPWTIPRALLDDGSRRYVYAAYPYAAGPGWIDYPADVALTSAAPVGVDTGPELESSGDKTWALQLDGEYAVGDHLQRASVGLRLQMPVPAELDTQWHLLWEPADGGTDRVVLGAEHLTWRFAQSPQVQFRTGVGPMHFITLDAPTGLPAESAPVTTHHGIDLFYGFQAFIGKPFTLDAQVHAGAVGQAFTWQGRLTIGAMLGALEVYGGYHHISVAGIPLGGGVAGTRAWF